MMSFEVINPIAISMFGSSANQEQKGIEGLSDVSRRPHNIKYKKVMPEIEETIIDLRLTKRFGCNRIKFRLKRIIGRPLKKPLNQMFCSMAQHMMIRQVNAMHFN
jgi:hypothetical protein